MCIYQISKRYISKRLYVYTAQIQHYEEIYSILAHLCMLKFGFLLQIIKMYKGIPLLKQYVNLHLRELINL